jgi:DHA1 family multidrug resistance protein-like MFS transporter
MSSSWKRTFWILWAGVLLCSSSYSMAIPFLPLFLFELGVGEDTVNFWAGVVHASAFVVGAFMAPLWGSVADKYGKKKMIVRAGLSLAVVYSLMALVHSLWALLIVRVLHGLVSGFVPASMSIVAGSAPKERMGSSLGMMQAGTMSGAILGPLFGGVLASLFGLRASFIVSGVLILLTTLTIIFWVHEGRPGASAAKARKSAIVNDFRLAFRNPMLLKLLLLLCVFQMSYNMVQPLLPLHIAGLIHTREAAVLSSGFALAVVGIAGIIASPLWGRAGERRGYVRILRFCLLASGAVLSLQFMMNRLWSFTLVQFVFGLFMAGVVPSINTLVVGSTTDEFRGRSFGLTTSANQIGQTVGPLLGGMLGVFLNIHWLFLLVGCLLIAAGFYVSARFTEPRGAAFRPVQQESNIQPDSR